MEVLTIGTFDTLHVGHLELLDACRFLAGDFGNVTVGLNRDAFVARYKGHAPVIPYEQRRQMLLALRSVNEVRENSGDEDSGWLIDSVLSVPGLIAIGSDWQDRDYLTQLGITQSWLLERGHRIAYVPRTTGQSSSAIREVIAA